MYFIIFLIGWDVVVRLKIWIKVKLRKYDLFFENVKEFRLIEGRK